MKMFIQDGILHVYYKTLENFDQEVAEICVHDRKEFTNHQPYPCLADVVQIKHLTKEARDFLAVHGSEGITANAIIVHSAVLKMMANFYINVNKPLTPTRMFTEEQPALEWLKKYRKN